MPEGSRPNPPDRSCQLVFGGEMGVSPWSNVMWCYLTGSGEITHATLLALANGAFGAYTSHILPSLSASTVLGRVQANLWSGTDELTAISDITATIGGHSGAVAPANVAACISWRIPQHYRGGHPRTYLSGVPQAYVASSNHLDAFWASSLRTGAGAFHTALEALTPGDGIATVEHGIVSFVHNKLWRSPPVFRRIIDVDVDLRIDTQRRRLGRDIA